MLEESGGGQRTAQDGRFCVRLFMVGIYVRRGD